MSMYAELYGVEINLNSVKFPFVPRIQEGYLELDERQVEQIIAHMYKLAESGELFKTVLWASESKTEPDGSINISGNHLYHFRSSATALALLFQWYNDKAMGISDTPDKIVFS